MKKILLMLFCLLLFTQVTAIEVTTEQTNSEQENATISGIQQDIKLIQIKINELPSKSDIDSSFLQIDQKIDQANQSSSNNSLGFIVGALLLNDILIVGLFIFAKTKGVFP